MSREGVQKILNGSGCFRDGKPGRADGFDDEEWIEEVRRLILDAVRRGERRQSLDTEQDDRDKRDADRQQRYDEAGPRSFRVLEQLPESTQCCVGRQTNLVGGIALGPSVTVNRPLHVNNE